MKEKLEKKIQELMVAREQKIAEANAAAGAIQAYQEMLKEIIDQESLTGISQSPEPKSE